MFPIPDFFCRLSLGEEDQVRGDTGVGLKDRVGQTDNGVQIAFLQPFLPDARLYAVARERAVGQHDGGASAFLEIADHE